MAIQRTDFDGDGGDDILFYRSNNIAQIYNGNGGIQLGLGVKTPNSLEAIGDFNGDGKQDTLVRWSSDSVRSYSGANNSQIANYGLFPGWNLRAVADFDGDGDDDLLMQRTSDNVMRIYGDGGLQLDLGIRDRVVYTIGIGDFNGDGAQDISLTNGDENYRRNVSGVDGSFIAYMPAFGHARLVAIADFDGDGGDDLLFQRGDGVTQIWNGEGGFQLGFGVKPNSLGHTEAVAGGIKGTGDFNGDGKEDILVQFENWSLRSYSGADASQIGNYGIQNSMTVTAIADFDGDGGDDILLQHNSTGITRIYDGNGPLQLGLGYKLQQGFEGVGDYNGDGAADVLFRWGNDSIRSYSGINASEIANYGVFTGGIVLGGKPPLLDLGLGNII